MGKVASGDHPYSRAELSLYVAGLLAAAVVLPLVVIGPSLLGSWLPERLTGILALYWPLVGLGGVAGARRALPRRDA